MLRIMRIYVRFILYIRLKFFKSQIVLLACMPKSGSSSLCRFLAGGKNSAKVFFIPWGERREQELCEFSLIKQLSRNSLRKNLIAQHHTRYSSATHKIITRYKIKVIFLYRDIPDAIMSLGDHMKKESVKHSNSYWNEELLSSFDNTPEGNISYYELVYLSTAGALFSLVASWKNAAKDGFGSVKLLRYEDIFIKHDLNPEKLVQELELLDGGRDISYIYGKPSSSRFNVGISGRGHEMVSNSPMLAEMNETLSKFYGLGPWEKTSKFDLGE